MCILCNSVFQISSKCIKIYILGLGDYCSIGNTSTLISLYISSISQSNHNRRPLSCNHRTRRRFFGLVRISSEMYRSVLKLGSRFRDSRRLCSRRRILQSFLLSFSLSFVPRPSGRILLRLETQDRVESFSRDRFFSSRDDRPTCAESLSGILPAAVNLARKPISLTLILDERVDVVDGQEDIDGGSFLIFTCACRNTRGKNYWPGLRRRETIKNFQFRFHRETTLTSTKIHSTIVAPGAISD